MATILSLIYFTVYLMFRWAFILIEKLYWRHYGLEQGSKKNPVRLMEILYRKKHGAEEFGRMEDFIGMHEKFGPVSLLADKHWSLYAFDRDYALFVKMPKRLSDMHIGNCPFIYSTMFEQAERIALIPLQEFRAWAEELEEKKVQPKTILFTNTARCGSTLLGQMLNHPGTSIVFGEHPALTCLSVGLEDGYFTEKFVQQMLKATVTVLRKNVDPKQLCVLKTSSLEARLAPILARVCPDVKHLFMFRKDGLNSVERMLLRDFKTIERVILRLPVLWPSLFPTLWMLEKFTKGEENWLSLIKPENIKEFAAVILASPFSVYLKNQQIYCCPVVYYEDLIDNPETTLKPVFKALDLPEERIKNAILCLNRDSQNNTFLDRNLMKAIKATDMNVSVRRRLDKIADLMDVPRNTFPVS